MMSIHRDRMSRRDLLRAALGAGVLAFAGEYAMADSIIRKPIPKTGEMLPAIGLGTWQTFDVGTTPSARAPLKEVLREFVRLGGSVVDSSPMYGRSESVTGDLAAELGVQKKLFLATKVWTSGRDAGIRQMEESFKRLRVARMDLLQVHNLVDWRTHLATLRGWKEQGRVRYIGITHYTASAYAEVERVLRAEKLDFLQINYALDDRLAEQRLLPLAAERGVAVIVNMPFGGGGLLRGLLARPLPDWASAIGCSSWAQVLLKFVLSHPAVTCAIPGTRRREHMEDNVRAGLGEVPPPAFWNDKAEAIVR